MYGQASDTGGRAVTTISVNHSGANLPVSPKLPHLEMALFDHETRSATVRALGDAMILTVDRRPFLQSVHEGLSLVFPILQRVFHRIRELGGEVVRFRAERQV